MLSKVVDNISTYNLDKEDLLREVTVKIGLEKIDMQEEITVEVLLDSSAICYESRLKGLSQETTLVLSNTRELNRVPNTK